MIGPDGTAPSRLLAFINREALDFSDAETTPPVQARDRERPCSSSMPTAPPHAPLLCQEWTLADAEAGVVEYPTQFSRFQNVSRLSLFFANNHGGDNTRIYYIGLSGTSTNLKREAVQTVYELRGVP